MRFYNIRVRYAVSFTGVWEECGIRDFNLFDDSVELIFTILLLYNIIVKLYRYLYKYLCTCVQPAVVYEL